MIMASQINLISQTQIQNLSINNYNWSLKYGKCISVCLFKTFLVFHCVLKRNNKQTEANFDA